MELGKEKILKVVFLDSEGKNDSKSAPNPLSKIHLLIIFFAIMTILFIFVCLPSRFIARRILSYIARSQERKNLSALDNNLY